MPKKQQRNWTPKTFVRFDLDKKQAERCKAWQPSFDDLDDILLKAIEANNKFTISVDNYNDCFQVSMQTDADLGHNSKLILVGRGSTPLKALKQVLIKDEVCGHEWPVPDFQERHNIEFDD